MSKKLDRIVDKIITDAGAVPPARRNETTLVNGEPVTPDHKELKSNGQQKDYVVLSEEERSRGYIRPVRSSYRHVKCGAVTTMNQAIAETYARDPSFYGGTFCCKCGNHYPLYSYGNWNFRWDDGTGVGS